MRSKELYLAALWQDLGGFICRAKNLTFDQASNEVAQFIGDHKESLQSVGIDGNYLGLLLAGNGEESDQKLLDEANQLIDLTAKQKGDRLVPLLSRIRGYTGSQTLFAPRPLELQEQVFKPGGKGEQGLDNLWKEFLSSFKQLPLGGWQVFRDTLLQLMHRLMAFVPVIGQPADMPMYFIARTRAAVLHCLCQEEIAVDKPFLFIGGDVSGIQEYLYDLARKGAAKLLKGRSFYLHLLADSLLHRILSDLQLPPSQVIHASGGGFSVLAPNTEKNRKLLSTRLRPELTLRLFESFKDRLFVSLVYEEIDGTALKGTGFTKLWTRINQLSSLEKKRRYHRLSEKLYADLFEPGEVGGETPRDEVTNEELSHKFKTYGEGENALQVSPITYDQIILAQRLKQADYWVKTRKELRGLEKAYCFDPCQLGVLHYFLKAEELPKGNLNAEILQINPKGSFLLPDSQERNQQSQGFVFYGGNDYPSEPDPDKKGAEIPLSFDVLAGMQPEQPIPGREFPNPEFKRLGTLRMDVDDLGLAIRQGFPPEEMSIARYSAMSMHLDYFFKGYLNLLAEKHAGQLSYIVYSGGDDLFIVGKWDRMADLAREIARAFKVWCGGNPKLSLSGGLHLSTPKFPVSRSAEYAEEHLDHAKEQGIYGRKNAFNFLGRTLHWEMEFDRVALLKNQLAQLIEEDNGVERRLLSVIQAHQYRAGIAESVKQAAAWKWQFTYDLERQIKRCKDGSTEAKQKLRQWQSDFFTNQWEGKSFPQGASGHLDLLATAARWLELWTRSQDENFEPLSLHNHVR